jgi:hypothetical protein
MTDDEQCPHAEACARLRNEVDEWHRVDGHDLDAAYDEGVARCVEIIDHYKKAVAMDGDRGAEGAADEILAWLAEHAPRDRDDGGE